MIDLYKKFIMIVCVDGIDNKILHERVYFFLIIIFRNKFIPINRFYDILKNFFLEEFK